MANPSGVYIVNQSEARPVILITEGVYDALKATVARA